MYNFYIFMIILGIISPIVAYNKGTILKKISISKEIMITTILILIFYGLQLFINKKDIMEKINNDTMKLLLINSLLIGAALYLGNKIISKENIFKFKSMQKSIYLIILVIISVCVHGQKLNLKILIGVLFIILGAYFIDSNIK